jgi:hypothetical protein
MRQYIDSYSNIFDSKRVVRMSLKNFKHPQIAFPFDKFDLFTTEALYLEKKKEREEKRKIN